MDVKMSDKKRRKKKRGVVTEMDYVTKKDGLANPYVGFFPSGFDPLEVLDDKEAGPRADFAAFRNPKPLSRQQEMVVQTNEDVDFVGTNYVGEAAGWQPCNYLLGVFDKDNGSLKLMPLAGEKVFRMEPRVRGLEYGRVIDEEAGEEEGDTLIKKRMLTEAFGSQRSRLRAARYERAQVKENDLGDFEDIENLFQEAAHNEGMLTTEQALEQANIAMVRNVPPYDAYASTPETVYLLDKMITPDEWEVLDVKELKSAASKTSLAKSLRESKAYPTFVLNRLKRLEVEGDKDGNQRRAHILLYMKHLLAFYSAHPSVIRKAADPWGSGGASNTINLTETLGIPGPIVARFLEIFTSKGVGGVKSGGCKREKIHVELSISYILVLGLMVDNFHTDPFDIASELKMTVSQLKPHYQNLGCKFEQRKSHEKAKAGVDANSAEMKWKVHLPVPLRFPKIANNARPRQRR